MNGADMTGADARLDPDRFDGGIDLYGIYEGPWITDDLIGQD